MMNDTRSVSKSKIIQNKESRRILATIFLQRVQIFKKKSKRKGIVSLRESTQDLKGSIAGLTGPIPGMRMPISNLRGPISGLRVHLRPDWTI